MSRDGAGRARRDEASVAAGPGAGPTAITPARGAPSGRVLLPWRTLPFPVDWEAVFGASGPLHVEVGFGDGRFTVRRALQEPRARFVGLEVSSGSVQRALRNVRRHGVTNVRVAKVGAEFALRHLFDRASVASIVVNFPDPWPKARHHKRRLIQPPLVALLASRLRPGGYLHCATDWENYAEQMLAVLSAEPLLENTAEGYAPRPAYRPLTKFEQRGLRLGHGVWDLVFRRR